MSVHMRKHIDAHINLIARDATNGVAKELARAELRKLRMEGGGCGRGHANREHICCSHLRCQAYRRGNASPKSPHRATTSRLQVYYWGSFRPPAPKSPHPSCCQQRMLPLGLSMRATSTCCWIAACVWESTALMKPFPPVGQVHQQVNVQWPRRRRRASRASPYYLVALRNISESLLHWRSRTCTKTSTLRNHTKRIKHKQVC